MMLPTGASVNHGIWWLSGCRRTCSVKNLQIFWAFFTDHVCSTREVKCFHRCLLVHGRVGGGGGAGGERGRGGELVHEPPDSGPPSQAARWHPPPRPGQVGRWLVPVLPPPRATRSGLPCSAPLNASILFVFGCYSNCTILVKFKNTASNYFWQVFCKKIFIIYFKRRFSVSWLYI